MIWKIWKKSKLNSETISKIQKKIVKRYEKYGRKDKLNCEMIWKISKKSKLKCEMIWKIWKKGKLNSEMIWRIWEISVCHNYTERDLLLLPLLLLLLRWPPSLWKFYPKHITKKKHIMK